MRLLWFVMVGSETRAAHFGRFAKITCSNTGTYGSGYRAGYHGLAGSQRGSHGNGVAERRESRGAGPKFTHGSQSPRA